MLSSDKINLEKIKFLLIDDNPACLDILSSVLRGFGAKTVARCASAKEARAILSERVIDVILTDVQMPEESGYDFIEWLRRNADPANRFAAAVVITSHTRISHIARARDCGAHFVIAKPITPKVVLERLFWVSKENRMYIETDTYVGLDRRFKHEGPPAGTKGRREDDPDSEVAADDATAGEDEMNPPGKPLKVAV
jgi:CheY-like chemotaxis protein